MKKNRIRSTRKGNDVLVYRINGKNGRQSQGGRTVISGAKTINAWVVDIDEAKKSKEVV